MPILIRNGSRFQSVSPLGFSNEEELELLLSNSPDLLRDDGGPAIAFVDRQVDLREAGILDLLFVSSDGLPIAVEVKLARNAQARREVLAQAIDYISSLTALTVDELDERVNGKLEVALRTFVTEEDDDFDRVWRSVGANLRAGLARLVVALDEVPAALERILRFLARTSQLDIQLVAVQRYSSPDMGEVIVPRSLLNPATEDKPGTPPVPKEPCPELAAVVDAYNETAPPDLRATGRAPSYRGIRPNGWPKGMRTHYEFILSRGYIGAELHIESDAARRLGETLERFAGKTVADGQGVLVWNQNWSSGRGRLSAQFPINMPPQTIAQAMRDLIALTISVATERLNALAAESRASA